MGIIGIWLGPKNGSQGWIPRLCSKAGSHGLVGYLGWDPRLCPKIRSQGCVTRVDPNAFWHVYFQKVFPEVFYKGWVL